MFSATELGTGMYNTTLRVAVVGQERPVILRIAPEPGRQFTSERALMRNEHASLPYLAELAPFMPHLIAVDFTHEIIGRDYMVQSLLDGIPATDHPRLPGRRGRCSTGNSGGPHAACTRSAVSASAGPPALHTARGVRRSPHPWRTSPLTCKDAAVGRRWR